MVTVVTVPGQPRFPRPVFLLMVACCSITCYICVEITICIFVTFRRYTGLYFWSMQVLTWSLLANNVANMTYFIAFVHPELSMGSFSVFTWNFMVSSQAVVLYSRLHLIVHDRRRIRWVPWMIAISLSVLLIPRTVLFYFASGPGMWLPSYVYHKIALFGLFVQELVICCIYIREAARALRPVPSVDRHGSGRVLVHLITANALIIFGSTIILVTEFVCFAPTEMSFHGFICAIKLTLEYFVLNKLCDVAAACHCFCQHTHLHSSTQRHSFLDSQARLSGNPGDITNQHGSETDCHEDHGISTERGPVHQMPETRSGTDITTPSPAVSVDRVRAVPAQKRGRVYQPPA